MSLRSSESWWLVSTVSISVLIELELKQTFRDRDTGAEVNLEWKSTPLTLWIAGGSWAETGFTWKGAKNSLGEHNNMGGAEGAKVKRRCEMASTEGKVEGRLYAAQ